VSWCVSLCVGVSAACVGVSAACVGVSAVYVFCQRGNQVTNQYTVG
jgi:hypothetical protein